MPTYDTCGPDVRAVVDGLIAGPDYPDLKEAQVAITLLYAYAARNAEGEPRGPALRHHGYPAVAIVKINSLQDRVEGKGDVTIRIDGDTWRDREDLNKEAVLAHELEHIEVCREKPKKPPRRRKQGGEPSTEPGGKMPILVDDCGRPKLRLRPHNWELGGFDSIVERYRENAEEAVAIHQTWTRLHKQGFFDFG